MADAVRSKVLRTYWAVPEFYTIGKEFETAAAALDYARSRIVPLDCGGFSRAWVDRRWVVERDDGTKVDEIIERTEVFANG